jgi:hypothetical protein
MKGELEAPDRRRFALFGASLFAAPDGLSSMLTDIGLPLRRALDGPRCAMEQNGIAAVRVARYRPRDGGTTGAVRCTPVRKPTLSGARLGNNLVVVSGLGGLVQRVDRNGAEMWRASLSEPRGIAVFGGEILIGNGRTIHHFDKVTGRVVGQTTFDWRVAGLSRHGDYLVVAFRVAGPGAVRLYHLKGSPRAVSSIQDSLGYPRAVLLTDDALFVADTFGHRVIRYGRNGGVISKATAVANSFFPNSVRLFAGKLLVTEEHINQVGAFDAKTLARLAPVATCRKDAANQSLEVLISGVNAQTADGESVCLARTSEGGQLLAPNDAVASGDFLYVADTDNHRIVMYQGGRPSSVLSNFNEPVNVDIVS